MTGGRDSGSRGGWEAAFFWVSAARASTRSRIFSLNAEADVPDRDDADSTLAAPVDVADRSDDDVAAEGVSLCDITRVDGVENVPDDVPNLGIMSFDGKSGGKESLAIFFE